MGKRNASLLSDFDDEIYLRPNPDFPAAGVDLGKHYIAHGLLAGRQYQSQQS
jgi:hypothetical protein